jgi:hypothetical protein
MVIINDKKSREIRTGEVLSTKSQEKRTGEVLSTKSLRRPSLRLHFSRVGMAGVTPYPTIITRKDDKKIILQNKTWQRYRQDAGRQQNQHTKQNKIFRGRHKIRQGNHTKDKIRQDKAEKDTNKTITRQDKGKKRQVKII